MSATRGTPFSTGPISADSISAASISMNPSVAENAHSMGVFSDSQTSANPNQMEVMLAQPRGFCAGVERAIEIVERALAIHGAPIYVRHEIVHNKFVVEDLRNKGAVFIEDLSTVPVGATLVFSAHGVPKSVRRESQARGFKVFDATCPLVTKVHVEVLKMRKEGYEIIMIGHKGHPEAEGTMGQSDEGMYLVEDEAGVAGLNVKHPEKLAYVTQTTLSVDDAKRVVDALKARFPDIRGPKKDDICYATQNRQDAVKFMAPKCDLVIVVGSQTSSNSNRLREVASTLGVEAYMVDGAEQIDPAWVQGKKRVGVTAGASAPEVLVVEVIAKLQELGAKRVSQLDGIEEKVTFPLPKGLRHDQSSAVGNR
jgi:4-hydroxy-3-methylbut-2-en-1-yl diphosphate reductase